jgi:predicted dehydrogenase
MRLQYVRLFHLRGDPMECNRDCDPVGVAVVGAGYWGPNLVRNFANCKQFRLRWLCDLDKRRAEAALGPYSTVAATSDLDAVLADSRIDAVAIATPAASHFALATAALRAGKHVLIEKPLAATYAEGAELVALAERNGLVLMCDHTYCHTPAVKKIREILHEGELGQLHFFDSVRINLGLVQRDVDVLWDLAPHDMSILDSILPPGIEPVTVAAWGADPIGAGHACIAFVTIELTGGAIAHLHVNWLSPTKVRTTMIGGSKRALLWDDLNPVQRVTVFDRGVDLLTPEDMPEQARRDAIISYRSGDAVSPAIPVREALKNVVEEFAQCIRTGRASITDGRSGLRVLGVLEAASRSMAARGAVVDVPAI